MESVFMNDEFQEAFLKASLLIKNRGTTICGNYLIDLEEWFVLAIEMALSIEEGKLK